MKSLLQLVFVTLVILFGNSCKANRGTEEGDLKIWFNKPAGEMATTIHESWLSENSNYTSKSNPDKAWQNYVLPIGNGYMGAGIYGGVSTERIQLNEKTIWTGGPGISNYRIADLPDSHKNIDEIRNLALQGKNKEAETLSRKVLRGGWNAEEYMQFFGAYQTLGELNIETGLDETISKNYRRELDISTGIITVSFEVAGVKYKREMFCSYPSKCLVVRFSADQKGKQNLKLKLFSPHNLKGNIEGGQWVAKGKVKGNGLLVETRMAVQADGGESLITEEGIAVKGASSATFILTAGTNYVMEYPKLFGEAPSEKLAQIITKSSSLPYSTLKENHQIDFSELFDRVDIHLGGAGQWQKEMPTNKRIQSNVTTVDHGLEALYFQFGRYLLISSSRPGSLPANLQGVWCNEVVPAWFSDYHLNINLQMNYWPAGVCNLIECQQALIDYIDFLSVPGSNTAKSYNNADGWTAHIHSNIWGFTSPNTKETAPMYWKWFPMGGPWLCQHVWDHFNYTQDIDYLKNQGYPLLKGSTEFIEDYVYELPDGQLSSFPSWSPEHGPLSKGATMDIAVMRETLQNAASAAEILGVDKNKVKEWRQLAKKLVKYKVGKFGQLQEWYEDIDKPNDEHRHINHLYGLYPGTEISPTETPSLAKAAQVTLTQRGDKATGWSMGWKINFWTRLYDGEHAYKLFRNLLTERTLPNLWDSHPPFQIDGNFGGTAGVAEMLLQSHNEVIHLLPALPSAWNMGHVKGLLARGNVEVDITWEAGTMVEAIIKPALDGIYKIRYQDKLKTISVKKGETIRLCKNLEIKK